MLITPRGKYQFHVAHFLLMQSHPLQKEWGAQQDCIINSKVWRLSQTLIVLPCCVLILCSPAPASHYSYQKNEALWDGNMFCHLLLANGNSLQRMRCFILFFSYSLSLFYRLDGYLCGLGWFWTSAPVLLGLKADIQMAQNLVTVLHIQNDAIIWVRRTTLVKV